MIILETDRLYLRELKLEDLDDLYKVLGDNENMIYYTFKFDKDRVKSWIEKNIRRYKDYSFGLWAVILKENDELIGDCGLTIQNIDGDYLPEIGYHIRRDYHNNGYATEASSAVRKWTFENTPFRRVYSYMKKNNIPSKLVAEKNNMTLIKEYLDKSGDETLVYLYEKDFNKLINWYR